MMKTAPLIAASLMALGLSSWSLAAETGRPGPGQGPCKADLAQFCQGIQPGGGRIAACLKEHKDQLSAACKQGLAERREHRKASKGPGTSAPQAE